MDTIQTLTDAYKGLSPEDKAKFNKENGLVPTKFQRTNITVSSPEKSKVFTQYDIHKMLVESGQFSNDCVDNDIANWHFDRNTSQTYRGCNAISGVVDKFTQNLKHREIIAEGKTLQTHMQVNLLQGALLAIELVKAGAINEKNRGVIIYLTETRDGTACRLGVGRDDDGKVKVNVNKVDPDFEYDSSNGVLSSN